jgi:hypothetical protein
MTGNRSIVAALVAIGVAMSVHQGLARPIQDPAERVVQVTWKAVRTTDGTRQTAPVFSPDTGEDAQLARQIVAVEEAYRVAKLNHDVHALDRLLSADFYGTNQNGNSRNKREALELFTSFPIDSLVVDRASIRFSGTTATVTGEQTEVNGTGTDRMLFTRVYVPDGAGSWLLLSNTQFRNPRATR